MSAGSSWMSWLRTGTSAVSCLVLSRWSSMSSRSNGTRAGSFGGRLVGLLADEVDERGPRLGAVVEAAQRVARFLVGRVLAQDVAPVLDGLAGALGLLAQLGELGAEGLTLRPLGHGALRVGEDLDEATDLVLGRQVVAEEREHGGVRRLGAPHLLEVGLRRLGAVAHPPVDHGDLEEDLELFARAQARLERVFVDRDEVVPRLGLAEVIDEVAHGLVLAGGQIEHALVGLRGPRFVLQVAQRDAREADVRGEARLLVGRLEGDLGEDLGGLLPLVLCAVEALEEERGLAAIGGQLEGLLEALDDDAAGGGDLFVGALEAIAVGGLRGGVEHRGLWLRLALHAIGGLHQLLQELGPALALVVDGGDTSLQRARRRGGAWRAPRAPATRA